MAGSANLQFAVATHVLGYLAWVDGARPVSSDELARSTNTNPVYVRRVLGPLREAGIVTSRPGAGGGTLLARPASAISLAELWALMHGSEPAVATHGPSPACPVGIAMDRELAAIGDAVSTAIERELAQTTVADLIERSQLGVAGDAPVAPSSPAS